MNRTFLLATAAMLMLSTSLSASLTTYFTEVDISDDARGINASATATITTGPGWMDIVIQNTSELNPNYANPYITELEFKNLPGFTLLEDGSSYVESLAGSYFSQGKTLGVNNAALQYGTSQILDYTLIGADTPGFDKCFMGLDVNNIQNNNTIASMAVLDGSFIPQEDYAEGFLDNKSGLTVGNYGAVFDSARFHFEFAESTLTPNGAFYTPDSMLIVKFAGGGDESYKHTANVPEPATMTILGLGGILALRKRKA